MAGSAFTWFLLLALWPVAGWGQDVYRCDSRYSPVACAGAKLKVDDVRTKEQKRDADMSTQKIRTLANAMEKDRLKQEAVLQKRAKPKLTAAARAQKKEENENLMPIIIEAVENLATLGEIADTLRSVFGEY